MKKIKTQTSASENNSHQASPMLKENSEEDNSSMLEEIDSPSTKSDYEHAPVKITAQKMIDDCLLPQRCISAPLNFSNFCLRPSKLGVNESQKQVKHALDVLQKKMLIEQHAAALREVLIKAKLAHEPLIIPPLISSENVTDVPSKKSSLRGGEDELDVIYGNVEYPFLSMSAPMNGEASQKDSGFPVVKSKNVKSKVSSNSSPGQERQNDGSFFDLKDFLTATRAETQRSESELGSALKEMSDEIGKLAEGKKRKNMEKNKEQHAAKNAKPKVPTEESKGHRAGPQNRRRGEEKKGERERIGRECGNRGSSKDSGQQNKE